MDAVSILVLTGQLMSLVSKLTSITKAISDTVYTLQDPAFISVKAGLVIEQISLARWLKHVDGQGGLEKVMSYMAEEDGHVVAEFYEDIRRLLEVAERNFERSNPVNALDRRNRISTAVRWSLGGKEDLESLLKAIHKLNEALENLVPAPPAYQAASTAPGSAPFSSSAGGMVIYHQKAEGRNPPQVGRSPSTQPPDIDSSSTPRAPRLRITSLIDIILIEESILSELVKDLPRQDLEQVLLSIVSSLSVEDARYIAANRPTVVLPSESGTEELLESGRKELESVVNDLYELLSTIRMIRRGAMLDLEAQQQQRQQTESATAMAAQAARTEAMGTQELLDTVITAVSPPTTEDQQDKAQYRDTSPRAPIGRKVVELLQEYKALHAAKLLGEDKELADRMLKEFLLAGENSEGSRKVDRQSEKGRLELQRRAQDLINDLPRPASS